MVGWTETYGERQEGVWKGDKVEEEKEVQRMREGKKEKEREK